MSGVDTQSVRSYLLDLQDRIIGAMEVEGGEPFIADSWTREPGGRLEGAAAMTSAARR